MKCSKVGHLVISSCDMVWPKNPLEFQSKMPRKSNANRARAANLQREKRHLPKPTVEEVEDEDFPGPDSHGCHDACPQQDDIIEDDAELLDIVGCLRGTAMVDDKDESSDSDSEGEGEDEELEIQEISALEQFSDTLQKAHDLALAAEQEQERGRKRPKRYSNNSDRTKWWCRQRGHELAAKEFHSIKEWLLQKPSKSVLPRSSANHDAVPTTLPDFQEYEESASEDEIWPARMRRSQQPCAVPVASPEGDKTSDTSSESKSETIVWEDDSQKTPTSEESLDSEEKEHLHCQNVEGPQSRESAPRQQPRDIHRSSAKPTELQKPSCSSKGIGKAEG
jgi:hypothetical protein